VLAFGGEVDAMVEITGNDIGAAADDRLERFGTALEIDDLDLDARFMTISTLTPALSYSPSDCASIVGR